MRTTNAIVMAALCGTLAIACGSDDNGGDGDGDIDAGDGDGDGDGDATHGGQSIVLELQISGVPQLGDGLLFDNFIAPKTSIVAPSYEEMPGSPFGCKVFEFTAATLAAQSVGVSEGMMTLTTSNDFEVPPCNHVPGIGYACVGTMGTGGDIAIVDAQMGIYSLTDAAASFAATDAGRSVNIQGSAVPSNNGLFPIVMVNGDTIAFVNGQPGADAEAATPAQYATVAGTGPTGLSDPMPDGTTIEWAFAGGDDLDAFNQTLRMGEAYTLDTASEGALSNIPLDGSTFTLGCAGAGGDCGGSMASIVNIITTDGALPSGAPPFVFPPVAANATQIFCAALSGSVGIPAEASAFLRDAVGTTRIRAVFGRINQTTLTQGRTDLQLATGHAIGGFTTPTAAVR